MNKYKLKNVYQDFMWKQFVCKFIILDAIFMEKDRQFDNQKFCDFCEKNGIASEPTTRTHPQANKQ